ncbi:mis18-binding protein 1-like isoform X1 [Phyllopteryx taeniolatus]|uniref:mis18-binding protein 1-like isoform X1 n=1 Tax=Phyllopteryx taeniolatus TaxID=161469 RepID=UPI002AD3DBA0|nr:mis18-binding protein 1-like isoform X1 [Phyllopteryx taeniolatus]
MASYQHVLKYADTRFQSPAKVFAMLKSKVQRGERTTRAREEHATQIKPASRRPANVWESNESYPRFGEVEASTISPIKSPKQSLGYSYWDYSRQSVEVPHATNTRHGFTSPRRPLMESTAVFPPRIRTDPRSTRDSGGPRKKQIADKSFAFDEDFAAFDASASPPSHCSPVKKKMRKRKVEELEMNKVCNSANVTSQSQDDNTDTAGGYPFSPKKNACRPVHVHRELATMKRSTVSLEKLLSPAKMFVYMKERVSRREQEQDDDDCQKPSEPPDGVVHTGYECHSNVDKMDKDNVLRRESDIESTVTQAGLESAAGQSDTRHPEEASSSAVLSGHNLLEDSIFLNPPSISIPKKHNFMFKNKQWPNFAAAASESTIHLKKWFLRKNRNGLFVQGIHMEDGTPWNSNIIAERVSSTVLKTISGNVYILVGKMMLDADSDLPRWLLRIFANGFPANWKELFEKCLSELKDRRGKVNTEKRSKITRPTETSALQARKKRHQQNAVRTSQYKTRNPKAGDSTYSTKVTRSGRLVKPPLDYWRGGRVFVDADLNVTIFECYKTSAPYPDVAPVVSMKRFRETAQAFLLNDKGHKRHESTRDPLTEVKTPHCKHNQVEVKPEDNPSLSTRAAVRRQSHHITSSDEKSSNEKALPSSKAKKLTPHGSKAKMGNSSPLKRLGRKRTPPQFPAVNEKLSESEKEREEEEQQQEEDRQINHITNSDEQVSNENKMPSQSNPKKLPVRESKKKVLNAPPLKNLGRKRTYPQISAVDDNLSESNLRKETEEKKEVLSTKSKGKRGKKRPTQQRRKPQTKSLKPLSPVKALTKLKQSKKKSSRGHTVSPQGKDEGEWTKDELAKLQKAVSSYPLHVPSYWTKVAIMVGTRSAEECHNKDLALQDIQTPVKSARGKEKKKEDAPKATNQPLISAGIGTFKRKQQVRQFLEAMPKENVNDAFSVAHNNRFEMPSIWSDGEEDLTMDNLEPLTPESLHFPRVKTPRCLLATPGMVYSPNSSKNEDLYVFQLQKMKKRNQVNGRKQVPAKSFSPIPAVKRTTGKFEIPGNNSFDVLEKFPEKAASFSDSGEEEDFYFSDND